MKLFVLLLAVSPALGAIGVDIQRRHHVDALKHDGVRFAKRRGQTITEVLDNQETLYFANVTLGTPSQNLRMHIDTGSSDMWCNAASSRLCRTEGDCKGGSYGANSSSTYTFLNSDFNISYLDGTSAGGDYVTDTLGIGGARLTTFQFGVGYQSSSQEGVLGIGYTSNEAQVNRHGRNPYSNLPAAMVDAKLIRSTAYSLWLNDLDANEGQILFGGVNTAKFEGTLQTLPVLQMYGGYSEFTIALTGIRINGHSIQSGHLPASVLLDSGSSLTYLPDDIATSVFAAVNAIYVASSEVAYVPCTLANNDSSLSFSFSGIDIQVPYNELTISPGTNPDGSPITFKDGTLACYWGVAPTGGSQAVLGDTFLRSAYVVYDLDNNEISLAQTTFNATANDIQEIGPSRVPDATTVPNPVTSVAAIGSEGARRGAVIQSASPPTPTNGVSAAGIGLATAIWATLAAGFLGLFMEL